MDRRCRRQDRLYHARQSLENGYCESFNSKLRDELLDCEIFYTLKEAQIVIEGWRQHYKSCFITPHLSMSLKRIRSADRDAIPRVFGFVDEQSAGLPAFQVRIA